MAEPPPDPPRRHRGWTAWGATWVTLLISSLIAAFVIARFSSNSAEEALTHALETHLQAQARLLGESLRAFPLDLLATLGGERLTQELRGQMQALTQASGLHDAALIGPDIRILQDPNAESWIPALAEADLIDAARGGSPRTGPLYRGADGEPYLTAYIPLAGHPGWVVAIEGSGASLGALDDLQRLQFQAGIVVLFLTGLLGAALASWVVRPLRRLDAELSATSPGDAPETLTSQGPQEVRAVAAAARRFLAAIRLRDSSIAKGHKRELEQLSRMAAEVAHEIRNPLNALSLSVDQLSRGGEEDRRIKVSGRIRGQIDEMEIIVQRLVDVAKPLDPRVSAQSLSDLRGKLQEEVTAMGMSLRFPLTAPLTLNTDPTLWMEILRNLCLNAQQAGATQVEIRSEAVQGTLTLDISDDGPGIPEGCAPRIFDWFYTEKATGSGLGLPTSRRMAQALGGDLELVNHHPAHFRLTLATQGPAPRGERL